MRVKDFINKPFDIDRLRNDLHAEGLRGVHLHEPDSLDQGTHTIELVIGYSQDGYAYAFRISVVDKTIRKIERVKSEWECGGWKGNDVSLKRFPIHFVQAEGAGSEALLPYLAIPFDQGCQPKEPCSPHRDG